MTTTTADITRAASASARPAERMRRAARRWRYLTNALAAVVAVVLLVWTFIPLYNMLQVALQDPRATCSARTIWPPEPSPRSFWVVLTQDFWYLEDFWLQ